DGDRGGEGKAPHLVVDAGVDQVDAAEQVVGVVEALDEVAQPLRRVGGQVVDVVEAEVIKQPVDQLVVHDGALDEAGFGIDVFLEAARQVIEHDDIEAELLRSDQVDAAEQVVGVVEALDEVAQPLRRVGGQVVDVVEAEVIKQPVDQLVVHDGALDEAGFGIDVFLEAARQVIEHDDIEAELL